MNKASAKRWLKEISFWAEGGELYYLDKVTKKWKMYGRAENLLFDADEDLTAYVINDINFKARKAFAVDKKVIFKYIGEIKGARTTTPSWAEHINYFEDKTINWYEDENNLGKLFMHVLDSNITCIDKLISFVPNKTFPLKGLNDDYKIEGSSLINREDLAVEILKF